MEKMSTRMMVEAGIMIALAQILSYVRYLKPLMEVQLLQEVWYP